MSTDANDEVNVLQLTIHDVLVGYLAGFKNGRNVLSIADAFYRRCPGGSDRTVAA